MFYKVEFPNEKMQPECCYRSKTGNGAFQGYNFTLIVLLYCSICLYLRYKRKTVMLIFVRNLIWKTTMWRHSLHFLWRLSKCISHTASLKCAHEIPHTQKKKTYLKNFGPIQPQFHLSQNDFLSNLTKHLRYR